MLYCTSEWTFNFVDQLIIKIQENGYSMKIDENSKLNIYFWVPLNRDRCIALPHLIINSNTGKVFHLETPDTPSH